MKKITLKYYLLLSFCTSFICVFAQNDPIKYSITYATEDADGICLSNGKVDVRITGGFPPYTFSWVSNNPTFKATTQSLKDIPQGDYTVTITDGLCGTAIFTVYVKCCPTIKVKPVITDYCSDKNKGEIILNPLAAGNYTYIWDDGQNTKKATNLSVGKHCVSISEEASPTCITELCYDVKDKSAVLAASIAIASVTSASGCEKAANNSLISSGGSIDLECSTLGCTYLWSNGATSQDINNLAAGTYTVIVTEPGGCTATRSVKICCCDISGISTDNTATFGLFGYLCKSDAFGTKVTKTQDFLVSNSITYSTTKPLKGSIFLSVMSGTGNYYYKWTKVNGGTLPPTFTSSIENAELGIYQVEITDGCSKKTLIFELKDCNANPLEIVGTIRQNCETFKYGKIDISILKGSGDYDITWNTGEKTTTIENLYAKLYTVKVIDKNTGCSLSSNFNVTDDRPIEECLCYKKSEAFNQIRLFSVNSCNVSGGKGRIKLGFNNVSLGGLPALDVKFKVFWPNGSITNGIVITGGFIIAGIITSGISEYPIYSAGSYTVKIQIDDCTPTTLCFPFGNGNATTTCFAQTYYPDFETYPIPSFFLLNTIRTRMISCQTCGVVCPKEPGVINGLGGDGDCKELKFDYTPIDKFNPCTGGSISTSCGVLNIESGTNGVEVLKLDTKKPVGEGFCEYECACIYPEGSVTNNKQFAGTQFFVKTKKIVADPTCSLPPPPPPPSKDKNCDGQIFTKPSPLYPDCYYDEYCLSGFGSVVINFKIPVGFSCIYNPNKASENEEDCYAIEYCVKTGEVLSYIKNEKIPCLDISDCNAVSKNDDILIQGLKNCACEKASPNHDTGDDNSTAENFIYEKKIRNKSNIYPNPFTGEITFSVETPKQSNVKLKIFNTLGAALFQQDYNIAKGKNEIVLQLDKIPNGIYLLQIIDEDNNTWIERVVKQ